MHFSECHHCLSEDSAKETGSNVLGLAWHSYDHVFLKDKECENKCTLNYLWKEAEKSHMC